MSVTRLDLGENELDLLALELGESKTTTLIRQLGTARNPARCPECNAIVYSRRHRLCGVCAQPLPEELLFTHEEARRVESLLTYERRQHRRWMEQRASCGAR